MTLTDTQRAYQLIKDKIVKTDMAPGAVVREGDLMAELGLGRTPIREALKLLEAERLVSVSPRRGIFVTSISLSDLAEIQEIRSVLDLLCVRLAAERITPREVAELQDLAREGEAATADPACDQAQLLEMDHRFHLALARSAHNRLLEGEIEMFYNLSMRIWYFYLRRLSPADLAFDALRDVIEGLASGNVEKAERAMRRHIGHFGDAIKRCL